MKNQITFTDTIGVEKEYYPVPASTVLPEWYKDMPSYIKGKKEIFPEGKPSQTIKRCMPVFDALTFGYIIPTYVDIYVRIENGAQYFSWSSWDAIEFHSSEQIKTHPVASKIPAAPKWRNPWSIKTPKGYSVLFTAPMHHPNEYFKVMEGVVDCDTYNSPVNFPFLMNDIEFEGLIPAGTPMVQVIPFKREKWEMTLGNDFDRIESAKTQNRLRHKFFDGYKTLFRSTKEFK